MPATVSSMINAAAGAHLAPMPHAWHLLRAILRPGLPLAQAVLSFELLLPAQATALYRHFNRTETTTSSEKTCGYDRSSGQDGATRTMRLLDEHVSWAFCLVVIVEISQQLFKGHVSSTLDAEEFCRGSDPSKTFLSAKIVLVLLAASRELILFLLIMRERKKVLDSCRSPGRDCIYSNGRVEVIRFGSQAIKFGEISRLEISDHLYARRMLHCSRAPVPEVYDYFRVGRKAYVLMKYIGKTEENVFEDREAKAVAKKKNSHIFDDPGVGNPACIGLIRVRREMSNGRRWDSLLVIW